MLDNIERVLKELDEDDAQAIVVAKRAISNTDIRNEIAFVHANYSFLSASIKALETQGIALSDALDVLDKVKDNVLGVQGPVGAKVLEKFKAVIAKNEGLGTLTNISKVLSGDTAVQIEGYKFTPHEVACFKYAPVTTCDVERSFSMYKSLLRDNRQSFAFDNLRMHLVIHCNARL